jgi:hypothetical protein
MKFLLYKTYPLPAQALAAYETRTRLKRRLVTGQRLEMEPSLERRTSFANRLPFHLAFALGWCF